MSDGGSVDPEKNVALFNVIKNARAGGVPKANIESALQKVVRTNFFFFKADMDVVYDSRLQVGKKEQGS